MAESRRFHLYQEWKMGPKLRIARGGIHLLSRLKNERADSLPRRRSRAVHLPFSMYRKGWVLQLDVSSKKPALLKSIDLFVRNICIILNDVHLSGTHPVCLQKFAIVPSS